LFEKAITLDPGYAPAYAGLADAYALLGSNPNSVLPRREAMSRARQAAQKALSLDPSLADPHASLGFVKMHYDWEFAAAEKEFLRAIELNPGYATAHHWYAYDLVALGRLDDAVREARRAEQADPLSMIISRDVGEMLMFAGRDDEAIAQCQRTLEMDPSFALAHGVLARAYHRKGMEKEFLREAELGKTGNSAYPGSPGFFYALIGNKAEARRAIQDLLRSSSRGYGFSSQLVGTYAYLGEKDRAFQALEQTFQERNGSLIVMRVEPAWEILRTDPRFEELARRVGLPSLATPSPATGTPAG
jgi:tetratricopeptide (TPR) repeat protein